MPGNKQYPPFLTLPSLPTNWDDKDAIRSYHQVMNQALLDMRQELRTTYQDIYERPVVRLNRNNVAQVMVGLTLIQWAVGTSAGAFDPRLWYSAATFRWTPKVAGYYLCHLTASHNAKPGVGASNICAAQIQRNGVVVAESLDDINGTGVASAHVTDLILMNGSTDYLESYFDPGAVVNYDMSGATSKSFFFATFLANHETS